jgi:hypothetical protein
MTLARGPLRITGEPLRPTGRHDLPRDIVVMLVRSAMWPASGPPGGTHFADPAALLALVER